jgi:putative Mn2+ efflux pump MntP
VGMGAKGGYDHINPILTLSLPRGRGGFRAAQKTNRAAAPKGGNHIVMKTRNKRSILTGGMILIGLGIMIILSKMSIWPFSHSWPLLLIIVATGTLIQRVRDFGGWIIGCAGVIFLISENFELKIYAITTFLLPVLLILVGVNVLLRYFKKKGDDSDDNE